MSDLNQVVISGRLTRDTELRFTKGGQAVCELTLASNRIWKNANGKQESTIFTDVVVWGKQAEILQNMLHKGKYVMVSGRLHQDSWQANDGSKRSKIVIHADKIDLPPKDVSGERYSNHNREVEEEVNFEEPVENHTPF